ncbi:hypothetical protein HKX48_005723 [Thoreauomyces humboldtii]|nr:hypothetical protein HKX48_005723 [Thoreauomyces humboldtii]
MTEYHSTSTLADHCHDGIESAGRPGQETGDYDAIRYTMSTLQLDSYPTEWSSAAPPSPITVGGLAGSGHKGHIMRRTGSDSTLDDGSSVQSRSLLVNAVVKLQRKFREKKGGQSFEEGEEEERAAVKIQATFRSFASRRELIARLQAHNNMLRHEITMRDARLSRSAAELNLRSGVIEQYGKTIGHLRRQLADLSSSYEVKMDVKDKQIEQLDRDLQIALRTTSDLKYRLESNAVEYAKMAWEFKEKDSDSVHQYTLNLQRDLESIRSQMSEMRSTREADGIRLSLKDKEIHELRYQMKEARRSLESDLSVRNNEIDELRMRVTRLQSQNHQQHHQQHQHQHQHQQHQQSQPQTSSSQSAGSSDTDVPPRAGSVASTTGCVKSIWSSGEGQFGLFGHEDAMYSNGSSTPVAEHAQGTGVASYGPNPGEVGAKGIWNPITCDLDFLNMSPAMIPMSAESLADMYSGECGMTRNSDVRMRREFDVDDYGDYSRNTLSSTLLPPAQEKNTAANFYFLVDKIVRTNDQPASLLLQQKLKTGTNEVKSMIFDAILGQAISLIKNRFGNFLMQRVLEFGTPHQIRILGQTMRGNVLSLACDRFGCHVIQKALDTVEEDLRASLISELFRCVRETITHRFACHVWQRIFQIKWNNEPPAIMHYLDASLKSQWHLIANDENGSLVVQCIFENCGQKEKGPILSEVLGRTVEVARGQWGNWVIQHILEHGSPADRNYVMKQLVHNFYPMAVDQYASKVVEKGLKLAPKREMYEMIETVLMPNPRDNGRPAILEMMNNQFANYVVQHILNLADPLQKDTCIRLLLPHIATLRNSKYGQRVAAIVEKHLRNSHQKFALTGMSSSMVGHGGPCGLRG